MAADGGGGHIMETGGVDEDAVATFWAAVDDGDAAAVTAAVTAAPRLLTRTREWGFSALHVSAAGATATVDALPRAGAAVGAPSVDGTTPLHLAALYGHRGAVGACLDAGAAVGAADACGITLLHLEARGGDAPTVAALVNAGAVVGGTDADGETPLHSAARYGNGATARALVAARTTVGAMDNGGATPSLQENLTQNTRFLTGNPRFSGISEHFMRVNLGFLAPEPGSCGSNRDCWSAHVTGAVLVRPECPSARAPRPLRSSRRLRAPCPAPPCPDAAAPRLDSRLGGGGHALSDRFPGARCPRPTPPRPRAPTSTGREDGAGRETQQCTGRLS